MFDVLIIGAGPSGVSLSLYLKRANIRFLVIDNNKSSLNKARIENYYGFSGDGQVLYNKGIEELKNNNVDFINDEVIKIDSVNNYFIVHTSNKKYETKRLVLAIGINKSLDKKYSKYLGMGVSLCAVCDAPFYKDKDIYLTGNKEYINLMYEELKLFSDKVHIINNDDIVSLEGEYELERIILKDKKIESNNLFIALPISSSSLSSNLGLMKDKDNNIIVDDKYQTNIKNLYAIGDSIKGVKQISKATYDGMMLGLSLIKEIKDEDN